MKHGLMSCSAALRPSDSSSPVVGDVSWLREKSGWRAALPTAPNVACVRNDSLPAKRLAVVGVSEFDVMAWTIILETF